MEEIRKREDEERAKQEEEERARREADQKVFWAVFLGRARGLLTLSV